MKLAKFLTDKNSFYKLTIIFIICFLCILFKKNIIHTIKVLDKSIFSGYFLEIKHKYKIRTHVFSYLNKKKFENIIKKNFAESINIYFSRNSQNFLGELFDKYGSDKGYSIYEKDQSIPQGNCYNDIYHLLFSLSRNKVNLLLECGIGTKNPTIPSNMSWSKYSIVGGSLKAWRDYFPNAKIIGIDIAQDSMFTEDRITTYICDQTSKESIFNFIKQAKLHPKSIDIIVDDGLHSFRSNISLFENTKHLLTDNGIYIIEDVHWGEEYINYFNNLAGYNVHFFKSPRKMVESEFPRSAELYLVVITKKISNLF